MTTLSVQLRAEVAVLHPAGTVWKPLRAVAGYSRTEPLAVSFDFESQPGSGWVRWRFARLLLDEGFRGRSGDGDVTLWPQIDPMPGLDMPAGTPWPRSGAWLMMALTSPKDGTCLIRLDGEALYTFLFRTYAAVPVETESDVLLESFDAELAAL